MAVEDLIVVAATDYAEAWIDGDRDRMTACLHPALAKRTLVGGGSLHLEETPFEVMTGGAVDAPKQVGRDLDVTVLDHADGIASARVISEPFVDLLELARFGERWLIVNVLYQDRPEADRRTDTSGILRTLDDYASAWFDRNVDRAVRSYHPDFVERRVRDPSSGALDLDEITLDDVIETVSEGTDEPMERRWSSGAFCVHGDIAAGKVSIAWWDVELHLARFGERWLIVNILYTSTWEPPA